MKKTKRAALYVRVSTEDQTTANQRPELEALAEQRGWNVMRVYDETASAVGARPVFAELVRDARRGRFDVVVVWKLDRLGRSLAGNVLVIEELQGLGVDVVSARDSWLDTTGPQRSLMIGIFSGLAQYERELLGERTKAGMARAQRAGIHVGRPRASPTRLRMGEQLVRWQGWTLARASKNVGVSESTLRRHLARQKGTQAA